MRDALHVYGFEFLAGFAIAKSIASAGRQAIRQ
jgi:hypothetical protein